MAETPKFIQITAAGAYGDSLYALDADGHVWQIAVLVRDGNRCVHCGCTVRLRTSPGESAPDILEFDHHPIPVWRGGLGTPDNVVVSCLRCNRSRGGQMSHASLRAYYG